MGKKRMGLGASIALGAVAGAVQGYGEGMAARGAMEGKAKYDMMVNQARSDLEFRNRMGELAVTQQFKASESQKTREASASENDKTRQTNLQLAGMKANKSGTVTVDKAFTMAKARHTEERPDGTGFGTVKSVDWDGVRDSMRRFGYGDQADALIGAEAGDAPKSRGLASETAFERAQAEAEDKAGYFSTDATDFKDSGGSREQFITERAQALMNGGGATPGQPNQAQTQMAKGTGDILTPQQVKAKYGNNPPVGVKVQYKGQIVVWDGKQFVPDNQAAGATDESVKGTLRNQKNY